VLAFVLVVMATPPTAWPSFALCAVLIAGLILLAQLPPLYVLKRSAVVVPFVLMIALFLPFFEGGQVAGSYNVGWWRVSISYDGLLVLWNVVIKSWLSALSLILLSATTPFPHLLKGLQRLGVPRVMVMVLSFMYRYLFVLVDEAMRMGRARDCRGVSSLHPYSRRWAWQAKTVGNMIGTLFLRSYERGERVYQAMLARGFDGEMRTLSELRFGQADLCFGLACCFCLAAIWLVALR
jgi:cobalt/nickel transport system permease protein